MEKSSRLEKGYLKMQEVLGETESNTKYSLNTIFPDLEKYMVEYVWGEIYTREALDIKLKEIAVVAALTALGNAQEQLKQHINGALNVGCTINEIKEILLENGVFLGPCLIGIW